MHNVTVNFYRKILKKVYLKLEFFFGHFAEINFRDLGFTKDFAEINFRGREIDKDFTGIRFQDRLEEHFFQVLRMILVKIDAFLLKQMTEIIDGFENL